jgi:hypothetical protein
MDKLPALSTPTVMVTRHRSILDLCYLRNETRRPLAEAMASLERGLAEYFKREGIKREA